MKANVKDGVEPSATTALPEWNEKYGSLVRPDKVSIGDTFAGSGVVAGRVVPMSPVAQSWSGGSIQSVANGIVSLNAIPPAAGAPAVLTNVANGQCGAIVRYDDTNGGYAGVVGRWTNSSTARVVAIIGGGSIYLQEKSAAGATTRTVSAALEGIANGDDIAVRLVSDGSTLTAYAGGVSIFLTGSSVNIAGAMCGLFFQPRAAADAIPQHKILQFLAGGL